MSMHLVELDDRDLAAVDRALRTRSAMLRETADELRTDAAAVENHAVSHVSMLLMAHQHGRCTCSRALAEAPAVASARLGGA